MTSTVSPPNVSGILTYSGMSGASFTPVTAVAWRESGRETATGRRTPEPDAVDEGGDPLGDTAGLAAQRARPGCRWHRSAEPIDHRAPPGHDRTLTAAWAASSPRRAGAGAHRYGQVEGTYDGDQRVEQCP